MSGLEEMAEIVSKKANILILEDDEIVIEAYVSVLNDRYNVVVARCGDDVYKQRKILKSMDLALVDYRLSDFSGIEIVKEIKKMNPSAVCIMVTGYGDEDLAVNALRSGVKDYIRKPVDYTELLEKIDFYLSLKKTGKERRENVLFDNYQITAGLLSSYMENSNQDKIRKAVAFIDKNCLASFKRNKSALWNKQWFAAFLTSG